MSVRPSAAIEPASLVDLLCRRGHAQPQQVAYTYLARGELPEFELSYGELDRQAREIAAALQQSLQQGDRALLLFPPGLEFISAFFGCLYAGVIAVPAMPPQPSRLERTLPRLRAITANARPAAVLTTASLAAAAEQIAEQAPELREPAWLAVEGLGRGMADAWVAPALGHATIAFLQYSSGSTALPKGVMLSHGNLLHNQRIIHHAFDNTEQASAVSWLPLYHDMGLIGSVIQPLYLGNRCIMMSPVDFLQRPARWLQAISRYGASTSGGPNFAYDLCVRRVDEEQRAGLDLSGWRVAFNGAEPIRRETIEQFVAAFAPRGFRREAFYPCYGLAETTLFVTGNVRDRAPVYRALDDGALRRNRVVAAPDENSARRTLVSSGRPRPESRVLIVDPDTRVPCTAEQVGEIWVAAPNVGQGYWDQPELSGATFGARLAGSDEGPFLRTGDLGFMSDGELFVTGRLKDLIIVRGHNYYPQDIELTAELSHPAVRPGCCAAFATDGSEREQVVVLAEIDPHYHPASAAEAGHSRVARHRRTFDPQSVMTAIRKNVSEQHELQVHQVLLLKAGSIPKTPSGKVQRHACRAAFWSGGFSAWADAAAAARLDPAGAGLAQPGTHRAVAPAAPESRTQ